MNFGDAIARPLRDSPMTDDFVHDGRGFDDNGYYLASWTFGRRALLFNREHQSQAMSEEHQQQSTSSVGLWRTCCIPFGLCIHSRWIGLGIGFFFVAIFIIVCFLMSTVWTNLLFNNCDVLQGTSNGGRCTLSLIYIIGVPLVVGVYVLFLPVLLYRIGKQNEENENGDVEAGNGHDQEAKERSFL